MTANLYADRGNPESGSAANPALDPAGSFAIAASAGSGKTHLLVSRMVRLLLAGADPGGILALTFTRKAAAEMRSRVDQRLQQLATADDAALDRQLTDLGLIADAHLRRRARSLYEQFAFAPFPLRAMTLHAFCQDVLSRFALDAQVPAGFTLTENESELARAALAALFEQIRLHREGRPAQALQVLLDDGFGESQVYDLLYGMLNLRGDWWAFTEVWRDRAEDTVVSAVAQLETQLDIVSGEDPSAAIDAPAFTARLAILARALQPTGGVASVKAATIEAALNLSDAARCEALSKALLTADGAPRSFLPGKKFTDAQRIHLLELHSEILSVLEAVRERQRRHTTLRRNAAAYELGATALDLLQTHLRREAALGFAELEWHTYRLLREDGGASWVRYRLDRRIEHILLDEFQDTNPTQWHLLLPLLDELAAGDVERARSLLVVGDAKQSIYGFRRAEPELLGEAAQYVERRLGGATLPLNRSWRSAPLLIDFINRVFAGDAGAALDFSPHSTHRDADWGAVEIAALVPVPVPIPESRPESSAGGINASQLPLRDPLTTPYSEPETRAAEIEGTQVASRILQLKSARLPVRDGKDVCTARAMDYGDIMILARNRTHLWAIEQAFSAAGIPFIGSTRGALLDTVLARDLMALLRWLDAPYRALDLAQVLRSPLFGASDEDLIRLAHASRVGGTLFEAMTRIVDAVRPTSDTPSDFGVATDDATRSPADRVHEAPLARAQRLLTRWLQAARNLPAHDLLDSICAEGDVARRFEAALPQDSRVRANLGALMQLILDSDAGRYPTLGRLNAQLETLAPSSSEAPDEAPPAASAGQVRVLTVHAAKGLEAPVVFLVNAAPSSRAQRPGWQVQWPSGAERPTQFMLIGKSAERDAISEAAVMAQAKRETREDLNLFYVALTRAQQYLFVSAFASAQKGWDWSNSWHARCWQALEVSSASANSLSGRPADARGECSAVLPSIDAHKMTDADVSTETASISFANPRLRRPLFEKLEKRASARAATAATDPDAAARGSAIHLMLQRLVARVPAISHTESSTDRRSLQAEAELLIGRAIAQDDFDDWLREARAVLDAPGLGRFFDPGKFRSSWTEVAVNTQAQGLGVIDRLIDDGDTLWVLDYKTHARPDPAILAARYREQLGAYTKAIEQIWPARAVRAGLILTATQSWIEVPRTD